MNFFDDKHIVVWSLDINSLLSDRYIEIREDTRNRIVTSHVSLLELAIKKSIGKLPDFVIQNNFPSTLSCHHPAAFFTLFFLSPQLKQHVFFVLILFLASVLSNILPPLYLLCAFPAIA